MGTLFGQQKVNFVANGVREAGITFIPPSDLTFEAALQPFSANCKSELRDLGPFQAYAVIVKNTSAKAILAVNMRWEQSYTNGRVPNVDNYVFNGRKNFAIANFLPGQAWLLFPRAVKYGANVAIAKPQPAAASINFQQASEVNVVVDAIIFGDGQLGGLDSKVASSSPTRPNGER